MLPGEEKEAKRREEFYKDKFEPLTRFLKKVYGDKVRLRAQKLKSSWFGVV